MKEQTDQDLFESCSSGDANCAQKMEAAQKDLNSYSNLLPEDDYELYKEKDSIENVLIGIDPNYPKWDTEGMKEFGYSMLSEPEGVLLCMGMTFGGCALLSNTATFLSATDIAMDIYEKPDDANYYRLGALVMSEIVDKSILGKLSETNKSSSIQLSTKVVSQLINKGANDLATGAENFDKQQIK